MFWLSRKSLVGSERDLAVIVPTQPLFETAQAPAVHADLQAAPLLPRGGMSMSERRHGTYAHG
jgi:hypothetical protein